MEARGARTARAVGDSSLVVFPDAPACRGHDVQAGRSPGPRRSWELLFWRAVSCPRFSSRSCSETILRQAHERLEPQICRCRKQPQRATYLRAGKHNLPICAEHATPYRTSACGRRAWSTVPRRPCRAAGYGDCATWRVCWAADPGASTRSSYGCSCLEPAWTLEVHDQLQTVRSQGRGGQAGV